MQKFILNVAFHSALLGFLITSPVLSRADDLHSLFSEPDEKPRAPASAWNEEMTEQLTVIAPTNREPASLHSGHSGHSGHAAHSGRVAKKAPVKTGSAGLRGRFPRSVTDGFEVRSEVPTSAKGQKPSSLVTSFSVVQRGDKHDLLYRNSVGSQASVSLDAVTYSRLRALATAIPAASVNLKKCQGTMQLIQTTSNGDRSTTFCLNQTSKAAEQVRQLGNTLVVFVR